MGTKENLPTTQYRFMTWIGHCPYKWVGTDPHKIMKWSLFKWLTFFICHRTGTGLSTFKSLWFCSAIHDSLLLLYGVPIGTQKVHFKSTHSWALDWQIVLAANLCHHCQILERIAKSVDHLARRKLKIWHTKPIGHLNHSPNILTLLFCWTHSVGVKVLLPRKNYRHFTQQN